MAFSKLLFVLAFTLLIASASAQNSSVPINAATPVNTTASGNAATPSAAKTTNASLPSNATLAVYRAVNAQALGLLGAISNGNIAGVSNYVAPDVQLVLPNTTAPVLLSNVTTLLPFFALLTPPAGSNVTVNNVSERYFYIIDSTNVLTVYEMTAGQLGNVYFTGFWQLFNSTTSPNGTWAVAYASITPAPNVTYIPQTSPIFAATPNVIIPNTTANIMATPLNASILTNPTSEAAVVDASNGLQSAFSNASLSSANVTSQYLASLFGVVLQNFKSPVTLNLTNPVFVTFFNLLRGRNATGTAAPQTLLSYKQLNNQSAILTTLVPQLPAIGDVYFIQLWQYLNASTASNTTSNPLVMTWQLTFASVNLAPNSAAAGLIVAGAPLSAPAPAPAPSTAAPVTIPISTTANGPGPSLIPPLPSLSYPPPPIVITLTPIPTPSPSPNAFPTAAVAGSISGAAIVIAATALALFCWLRQKKGQASSGSDPEGKAIEDPKPPTVPRVNLVKGLFGWWSGRSNNRALPDLYSGTENVEPLPAPTVPRKLSPQVRGPYKLRQLKAATNNFVEDSIVGKGSFGVVYKATLADGSVVAVKRLEKRPGRRQIEEKSWKTEVEALGKVRQKNLVPLLGVCMDGGERLLIFEFFQRGSLYRRLHEPREGEHVLSWAERMYIVRGICRGLSYLHNDLQPPMLHRDIKAANVLLKDGDLPEACIADFGLAHLVQDMGANTSTMVKGTVPYMAPEYLHGGARFLSSKCDVYSFGILLLEIVSGRHVVRQREDGTVERLSKVAANMVALKRELDLVDPKLGTDYDVQEALCCIHVAMACLIQSAPLRPTMEQVVADLLQKTVRPIDFSVEETEDSESSVVLGSGTSFGSGSSQFRSRDSTVLVASRFITPR